MEESEVRAHLSVLELPGGALVPLITELDRS